MERKSENDGEKHEKTPRKIGKDLQGKGDGLDPSIEHLYRGEVYRMRFWRERLDRTTYWAIVVMSAILTWTFSSNDNPHYILLVGMATVSLFLIIEARRYRGYDIWRGRVRTLKKNVFAYGLNPDAGLEDPEWYKELSQDYRTPTIKISAKEALAHRLRRVYLPLFTITLAAWIIRIAAFAPRPWPVSVVIGSIPGLFVTAVVMVCYLLAVCIALRPRTWQAEDELHKQSLGQHR